MLLQIVYSILQFLFTAVPYWIMHAQYFALYQLESELCVKESLSLLLILLASDNSIRCLRQGWGQMMLLESVWRPPSPGHMSRHVSHSHVTLDYIIHYISCHAGKGRS